MIWVITFQLSKYLQFFAGPLKKDYPLSSRRFEVLAKMAEDQNDTQQQDDFKRSFPEISDEQLIRGNALYT